MSKNLIALQNKFLGHGETVYDKLSNLFEKQGYISDDDIMAVAKEHNLPPQHVRSTAKFYEELAHDKPATRVVKVCNGEACQVAGPGGGGCARVEEQIGKAIGIEPGETSDAGVRFEHVACLGYCGLGPNAMLDGKPVSARGRRIARQGGRLREGRHGARP